MDISEDKASITKIIHVAILSDEPLGWGSGKHYFPLILHNYTWKKNNITYQIKTKYITGKEIICGLLNISNYDVFLVPGGGVGDGEAVVKGFHCFPGVKKWKKCIQQYVQQGGSYIGICGGTALCTQLETNSGKHETLMEKLYHKSAIGISDVKSYYKDLALPIFCLNQRNNPEKIGAMGYIFSFAPGETEDGLRIHAGGVPIDFIVNNEHPIFADVSEKTIRIRWWGGPGLMVPKDSDRKIDILASYPSTDISNDDKTAISAWIYSGGLIGLIKGVFSSFSFIKKEKLPLKNLFVYAFYLSGNWIKSEKIINLDLQNKPSITTEIFPNENAGRVLLCTSHPEYMIWWNGNIQEEPMQGFHSIGKGFRKWKDISNLSSDLGDEFTHTWWIVRRFVAWAAKIPDDHLPPVEPGIITQEAKEIISRNVLWDETLLDQMKNI